MQKGTVTGRAPESQGGREKLGGELEAEWEEKAEELVNSHGGKESQGSCGRVTKTNPLTFMWEVS